MTPAAALASVSAAALLVGGPASVSGGTGVDSGNGLCVGTIGVGSVVGVRGGSLAWALGVGVGVGAAAKGGRPGGP